MKTNKTKTPVEKTPVDDAPGEEASLQLCILVNEGMSVSEARKELARREKEAPGTPVVESHASKNDLKAQLTELGVDFHPSESRERLAARLAEAKAE